MGPYCKFCDRRCFCYFPDKTPKHILEAYGTCTIIATCPGGQAFEKEKVGYCYNDIMAEINRPCEHPKVAIASRLYAMATREDPAEYVYRVICMVCGEHLGDEVPDGAEELDVPWEEDSEDDDILFDEELLG